LARNSHSLMRSKTPTKKVHSVHGEKRKKNGSNNFIQTTVYRCDASYSKIGITDVSQRVALANRKIHSRAQYSAETSRDTNSKTKLHTRAEGWGRHLEVIAVACIVVRCHVGASACRGVACTLRRVFQALNARCATEIQHLVGNK
jgi:hypothetical protein